MKENVGIISDNRIAGSETEFLAKYLKQEDICSLNNADVLEEVLRNVESSVSCYNSFVENIINIFISMFSVLISLLSRIRKELYVCFLSLVKSFISLVYPGKTIIKLRIVTVMPAFLLLIFIFSPTGNFIRTDKVNFPQFIATSKSFNNTSINENQATLSSIPNISKAYSILSKNSYNDSLEVNKKQSPTLVDNKVTTKTVAPSAKPAKKIINPEVPKLAKNKTIPIHENIISRSDQQRVELPDVIKNYKKKLTMKATAYDLSVRSCSKTPDHPAYGITKSGARATVGRTIAVDPSVIPIRTKVYISFPEKYKYLDGIYFAEDTGSLIKGNEIDVFFGEDKPGELKVYNDAREFGVQSVVVYILE